MLNGLAEFEIIGEDNSEQTGSNGLISLSILPDAGDASLMRKRNAIKKACTPAAHKVQWLYGELDGVRVYLQQTDDGQVHAVLTKKDLYP